MYQSSRLGHPLLPPYARCKFYLWCFAVVDWGVSPGSVEVIELDGSGWPPTHPYLGSAAGVAVPYDPNS